MSIADELRQDRETKYKVFKDKYAEDFLALVVDRIKAHGYFEVGVYEELYASDAQRPKPDSLARLKTWLMANIKHDESIKPYGFDYCVRLCEDNGFRTCKRWSVVGDTSSPCQGFYVGL